MPRVNDTHSCENNWLLRGKVKKELGFPGNVYSDEEAQFSSYTVANADLDCSQYSVDYGSKPPLRPALRMALSYSSPCRPYGCSPARRGGSVVGR